MTINNLKSSVVLRLLFCCGIAVLSAFLMRGVIRYNPFAPKPGELSQDLITENGFQFEKIVNNSDFWLGPKIGFSLDTAMLEDQQEHPLSPLVESEDLTMLVVVDRHCQVCTRSTDYFNDIKQQLAQRGIKYGIVSFKIEGSQEFFGYANQLKIDAPSFLWVHRKAIVPSPLSLMMVPTHVMIDRQHRIRGIWPGGGSNQTLRSKMSQQIIRDVDGLLSQKTASGT
jgi:hypothetical protein